MTCVRCTAIGLNTRYLCFAGPVELCKKIGYTGNFYYHYGHHYLHCPHSMRSRICETVCRPSVCPSVCPFRPPQSAAAGLLLLFQFCVHQRRLDDILEDFISLNYQRMQTFGTVYRDYITYVQLQKSASAFCFHFLVFDFGL